MAVAFPSGYPNPSYDFEKQRTTVVLRNDFGDGYSERVGNGINNVRSVFPLTWRLTIAQAEALDAFFSARGGYEAISWTPPREDDAILVVCAQWSVKYLTPEYHEISATFERVFDLS